jgi:hypothetical protein
MRTNHRAEHGSERDEIGDALMQDYLLAVTTGEYGAVSVRDWKEADEESVDPWADDDDG